MKTTDTHIYFYSKTIYSNWYPCWFYHPNTDLKFCNSEQHFMWQKACFFGDDEIAKKIYDSKFPSEAKELGRQVKNFNLKTWDCIKFGSMNLACLLKFSQNPELESQLLATGDKILVEASKTDLIWGVGLAEDDPLILDKKNWRGTNLLGEALMNVRRILRIKE